MASNRKHPFHSAIIVAGGDGCRMGGEIPKQMMPLCGIPVVIRTLLAFENCPDIDEMILVGRDGDKSWYGEQLKAYPMKKLRHFVTGGKTRQESVLNGFKAVSEKSRYVSIHDAARCLITPEQITAVARTAYKSRAAAAASRIPDTVKQADSKGRISATLDRDALWCAATPQTFQTELYRACAYTARERSIIATDDCMLCEAFGFSVTLVDCGRLNFKLTTPEDLLLAKAVVVERERTEKKESSL